MRLKAASVVLYAVIVLGAGCQQASRTNESVNQHQKNIMRITSPAFGHNQPIPSKYTCDGSDIIPPLAFEEIPTGAKSLALIMEDPDAPSGTWDHWIVFDMPGDAKGITEGEEPKGIRGKNSSGDLKYGGPCPPSGQHRYVFKLYALDTVLGLKEGASKNEIESAIQGRVLDQAELIGVYNR